MIKEKDLVPGRVITSKRDVFNPNTGHVVEITAWLIVGLRETVERRHSKSTAPRAGWQVILLSFGGKLVEETITPSTFYRWKRLF